MDSADVLEDKDSGPEVQLNLPGSVLSRIEELMGGTEQFDSEEARNYIQSLPELKRRDFREVFRGANALAINLLELMLELDADKARVARGR